LLGSNLKFVVFWVVAPCSVVVGYRHFGGLCCLSDLHDIFM